MKENNMSKIITPNTTKWDTYVRQQPRAHVLQLSAWGKLKRATGWQEKRIAIEDHGEIIAGAQVLFRQLPMRLGTLAYIPFGAYVNDTSLWADLWAVIDQLAKQERAILVKWEAGYYIDEDAPDFVSMGFRISEQTIQPPNTVMIDIHGDDDSIMKRMNQGTRRKIRKSLKNDVIYREGTTNDAKQFADLMVTTGERNEFGVHTGGYYEHAYDLFVPQDGALIIAEMDGELLAGNFVFGAGNTAYYLYGASSNNKRNLMASYGVQWQGIQWAKARDYHYYDMWGVPDEDIDTLEAQFKERNDGLWGVYGFKRGWGGEVIRSVGAWDKVYNPLLYQAYLMALRVRG